MSGLDDESADFDQDVSQPGSGENTLDKKVSFQVKGTNQYLLKALYAPNISEETVPIEIREQLEHFDGDIYDMLMFLDKKLGANIGIRDEIMKVSEKIMELKEELEKILQKGELRIQEIKEDFVAEMTRTLFNIAIKIRDENYIYSLLKKEQGVEVTDIINIYTALKSACKKIGAILELLNLSDIFKQHNEVKSVEDLAKAYERYKDIEVVSLMTDENVLDNILYKGIRNNIISFIGKTNRWKDLKVNTETMIRRKINLLLISYFLNREINYNIIDNLNLNDEERGIIVKILKNNLKSFLR